jgi:flagellar biosynthesis GTPase FlhF
MPWVRLDDHLPSNRKIALLSDRAFKLYIFALCWSSANLTEGRIVERELPLISRIRSPRSAADELAQAGLWESVAGGWVIHDFLEYNPDRARVKAQRAANAARQQAFRDRKKAEREAREKAPHNAPRNGVTDDDAEEAECTTATRTRHERDTKPPRNRAEETDTSQVTELRNAVNNAAPSRPGPITTSSDEEVGDSPRSEAAADEEADEELEAPVRADVEMVCRALADAIEANGSKRPTITKTWRNSARLLIDRDGRTQEQILTAIAWCQKDDFWSSNVLSMPTLRKQYDRLRLAAQRQQRALAPTGTHGHTPWRNPENHDVYDEDLFGDR